MEEKVTELRRSARNDRILAALAGAAAIGSLWLAFSGEMIIGFLGFAAALVWSYRLLEIANKAQDKADELAERDTKLRHLKGEIAA